jgi:hypothetical protein
MRQLHDIFHVRLVSSKSEVERGKEDAIAKRGAIAKKQ